MELSPQKEQKSFIDKSDAISYNEYSQYLHHLILYQVCLAWLQTVLHLVSYQRAAEGVYPI